MVSNQQTLLFISLLFGLTCVFCNLTIDVCNGTEDNKLCPRYDAKYCTTSKSFRKYCCNFCAKNMNKKDRVCLGLNCGFGGEKVCGTNGRTYMNRCELQKARQCESMKVDEEHEGLCKRTRIMCDFCFSYDPVCGSDGKTYDSKCFMSPCNDSKLRVLYKGPCKDNPLKCPIRCPSNQKRNLCATDGKEYSQCELEHERKCKGRNIAVFSGSPCGNRIHLLNS